MRIEIGEAVHPDVTAADIARLIPDQSPDRYVVYALVDDLHAGVEAAGDGTGRYELEVIHPRGNALADPPVDGATVRRVMTSFLAGDDAWRRLPIWAGDSPGPAVATAREPWWRRGRAALIATAVVVPFALAFGMDLIMRVGTSFFATVRLPSALDSVPARLFAGFFFLIVAVFAVAAIVKAWEIRKARRWVATGGRVIASERGFDRERSNDGSLPRDVRVARIRYRYEVAGRAYEGTRVSFAEKTPEAEVDAILAKYPKGAVVTVHHDPADPSKAVLERDGPEDGLFGGCFMLFGIGLCVLLAVMWGVTRAPDVLRALLPRSEPYLVLLAGGAGLLLLLLAVAGKRRARDARRWPRVPARILVSTVVPYKRGSFSPLVEYEYTVGGVTRRSRQILLDTERGGDKGYATKLAARYPVGATVEAHVDPNDPDNAALETSDWLLWLLVAMAVVFLGVAVWAARPFG